MAKYYHEDDEDVVVEKDLLDGMQLMRLNDCGLSTRMGMVDQGFPSIMKRLQSLDLVVAVDKGFQCSDKGFEYLAANKRRIQKI